MQDKLSIFNYNQNEIRTVMKDGDPWWVLKDICDVLELSNPSMIADRLDDDEQTKVDPKHYLGSRSNEPITVINESGLYNVILLSRKPEAKQFKRWITHEVIPAIRKHGAYMTPETIEKALLDPDTIISIATKLKEERQLRQKAELQLEEQKPKVIFADAVSASKTTILIGELAKLLKQNKIDIGQNRLFKWLRDNDYLIKRQGTDYNSPTQKAMDLGLFTVKETTVTHSDGHISVNKTTKVTGKGQSYFINKFLCR